MCGCTQLLHCMVFFFTFYHPINSSMNPLLCFLDVLNPTCCMCVHFFFSFWFSNRLEIGQTWPGGGEFTALINMNTFTPPPPFPTDTHAPRQTQTQAPALCTQMKGFKLLDSGQVSLANPAHRYFLFINLTHLFRIGPKQVSTSSRWRRQRR